MNEELIALARKVIEWNEQSDDRWHYGQEGTLIQAAYALVKTAEALPTSN